MTEQMPAHHALCETCYRCRALVPNGLVHRQTLATGYLKGTVIGTGIGRANLYRYEMVSLCGVCAAELSTTQSSFWRYIGVIYGTTLLTGVGSLFLLSLVTMLTLAKLRVIGKGILIMHGTALVAVLVTRDPYAVTDYVMTSWWILWAGLIGWKLWQYPSWSFRSFFHKPRARQLRSHS